MEYIINTTEARNRLRLAETYRTSQWHRTQAPQIFKIIDEIMNIDIDSIERIVDLNKNGCALYNRNFDKNNADTGIANTHYAMGELCGEPEDDDDRYAIRAVALDSLIPENWQNFQKVEILITFKNGKIKKITNK